MIQYFQDILKEGLDRFKAKDIPINILKDIENFINKIKVDKQETYNKNKRLQVSTSAVDTARNLFYKDHVDPVIVEWLENVR